MDTLLNFDENWSRWSRPTLYMSSFEYDMVIELYRDLFGKDNVTIGIFEKFTKDPKNFLYGLCESTKTAPCLPENLGRKLNVGTKLNLFFTLKQIANRLMKTRIRTAHLLPSVPTDLLSAEKHCKQKSFEDYFGDSFANGIIVILFQVIRGYAKS